MRDKEAATLRNVHALLRPVLLAWPAAGLCLGLWAMLSGFHGWSGPIWAVATIPVLLALVIEIAGSLRRGEVGLDIVAALSMAGALVLGETLAAVVVGCRRGGGWN